MEVSIWNFTYVIKMGNLIDLKITEFQPRLKLKFIDLYQYLILYFVRGLTTLVIEVSTRGLFNYPNQFGGVWLLPFCVLYLPNQV